MSGRGGLGYFCMCAFIILDGTDNKILKPRTEGGIAQCYLENSGRGKGRVAIVISSLGARDLYHNFPKN